jgi:hypothetical protein
MWLTYNVVNIRNSPTETCANQSKIAGFAQLFSVPTYLVKDELRAGFRPGIERPVRARNACLSDRQGKRGGWRVAKARWPCASLGQVAPSLPPSLKLRQLEEVMVGKSPKSAQNHLKTSEIQFSLFKINFTFANLF